VPAKVLLAGASAATRRVVALTFATEEVQVVLVGDGDEAIAAIPVERPDVVLADIEMPKRSGYDVAAFVKGHPELSHVPVLLLAGALEPVDPSRAAQLGSDGIIVKPFEPQQLALRVRELVARGAARRAASAQERRAGSIGQRTRPGDGASEGDDLDEYFARLDAAFATLGARRQDAAASPRSQPSPSGGDAAEPLPTIEGVLDTAPGPPPVNDEFVEAVAQRVLERVAADTARALVAPIVSEVSERLVREEIDRIRSGGSSGPHGRNSNTNV
jgi:CheY-like chemotaxis protein